jgi:ABC-type Na+ efflux pump permease subunit
VDTFWQIAGFICFLLLALPVFGLIGGGLLRAGCHLVGVRMPGYLRAGFIFLLISAAGGASGFMLVYLVKAMASGIGLSPGVGSIAGQFISLPIHGLISAAAYVYFLKIAWRQGWLVWVAQLGIVVAVAIVIGLMAGMVHLPIKYQAAVFAAMVLVLAVLLRQGWITLFGPVLFYDLVRIARRGRYILLRIAYALLLLMVLWSTYASFSDQWRGGNIPAQELSKVAGKYFFYFLIAQIAVVVLLTPAFTASAIAEEKERKTLEFLLATDLRNREIVLSKLASRYCNLALLVMTGLPILSLTQFMGGVDPDLVLAGFAVTGVTMASLASLSILQSVYAKKPRDAIVLTYLGALGYLVLASSLMILAVPITPFSAVWNFGVDLPFDWGLLSVKDLVEGFNSGNILFLYGKLAETLSPGSTKTMADVLLELLRNYGVFHLTVALGCAALGVWKLRDVALQQTYGKAQKVPLRVRWFGRPACGQYPMIWKEVFAESGVRLAWFGRIVVGILVGISFIPAVWIIIYFLWELIEGTWQRRWPWRPSSGSPVWDFLQDLGQIMNIWVRVAGTVVAFLLLLAVAVRAATTVSGERDRQTMDSLLTTPLDSTTILFGKLLGSILSVRWGWLWLGLIWGIGLVTTGLNILALPLVAAAWFIYAVFLTNIGLWFSVNCRTSLRATIWTILSTLMCFGGHWLCWLCCIPFFLAGPGPGKPFEEAAQFQMFGLTPPFSMGMLAFQGYEFQEIHQEEPYKFLAFALFGLVFWSGAALVLWTATCARFRALSGRAPLYRRAAPARMPMRMLEKQPLVEQIRNPNSEIH